MSGSDADIEQLVGSTVGGKYRIERLIGRGGMGAVFEARNLAIGKRVALKFLDREAARNADAVTRFQREAEAASAVESAQIVQIFDSGTAEQGLPFLVMELLRGEDLRARLRREGRLEVAETAQIAGQVLKGLSRAHAAGIVHRDLKPDNVYLSERDDEPLLVKIVDFGISKVQNPSQPDMITRRGTILGTAFYMSPEQAQCFADIDGRTDLWSLGAILYECLTGRPPHLGAAYEAVLIAICTTDAEDVRVHAPGVPEPVAAVIGKALQRDREQRFQTAEEFYRALADAVPGALEARNMLTPPARRSTAPRPSDAVPTGAGTAVRLPHASDAHLQRRRTLVAALVAALGAFALTAYWMARQPSRPAAPPPAVVTATPAPKPAAHAATATPVVPTKPEAAAATASSLPAPTQATPSRPVPRSAASPRARATPAASTRAPSGVASQLELSTSGP